MTGAAKRIGRSIALALAELGADVAISYRTSQLEAEQTLGEIARLGREGLVVRADLCDPVEVGRMVAEVVGRFGRVDLVVNNAGMFESVALEDITVEQWDRIFATNTRAPFLVARAALPHLRKVQGRIINIGSLGGVHAWVTHGHYCTSKAALHMLSQTMAKAWAPEVSVNCVAPGMIVQGEIEEAYEHFAQKTPMHRNGTAVDVAAAVLFFATTTTFITGQTLVVDGGLGLT